MRIVLALLIASSCFAQTGIMRVQRRAAAGSTYIVNSPFTGLPNNALIDTYTDPVSSVAWITTGTSQTQHFLGDGAGNLKAEGTAAIFAELPITSVSDLTISWKAVSRDGLQGVLGRYSDASAHTIVNGYACATFYGTAGIYKISASTYGSAMATGGAVANGDTLSCQIATSGANAVITMKINGAGAFSWTDTTGVYGAGAVGMFVQDGTGKIDDFKVTTP